MVNGIARILRLDAALELVFAAGCLAAAVAVPAAALPVWFGPPVLVALAVLLVAAGALLGRLARNPTVPTLRAVALGNAVTAAGTMAIALFAPDAGGGLRIGLAGCALIIAGLAVAQLRITRRPAARKLSAEISDELS